MFWEPVKIYKTVVPWFRFILDCQAFLSSNMSFPGGSDGKESACMKKLEPSCIVDGNVKWCRGFGKQVGSFSKC